MTDDPQRIARPPGVPLPDSEVMPAIRELIRSCEDNKATKHVARRLRRIFGLPYQGNLGTVVNYTNAEMIKLPFPLPQDLVWGDLIHAAIGRIHTRCDKPPRLSFMPPAYYYSFVNEVEALRGVRCDHGGPLVWEGVTILKDIDCPVDHIWVGPMLEGVDVEPPAKI